MHHRAVGETTVVDGQGDEHGQEPQPDDVDLLQVEAGQPTGLVGGRDGGDADAGQEQNRSQEHPVEVEDEPAVDHGLTPLPCRSRPGMPGASAPRPKYAARMS